MPSDQMVFLLVDLVLIAVAARVLGRLAERLGQPAVIGEITAGIIAGPTILGAHLSGIVFPHDIRSYIAAFANVGVMIFMFLAGLEIDRGSFDGNRRAVASISLSAYFVPFLLGCVVALTVLPRHHDGSRLVFALFIGCSLAVTAFPVLARILFDRGMMGTRIGQLSLASAAIDDILAWTVLAFVIGMAKPGAGQQWRLLLFIPLVAAIWWIVRPLLARVSNSRAANRNNMMVFLAVSGALLFGAATEWIGLHLIFGAFLFGVIFPRTHRPVVESGAQLLSSVFLPAFFVIAGLQVDLGSLDKAGIAELLAILLAALAGKLGGTYAAARFTGIDRRSAAGLASLMNTRGLTELIILTIGLSTGLIGVQLYSILVVMALVTTAMTAPLLRLFGVTGRSAEPAPATGDGVRSAS
ncbi:putative sodium/hydrogen antiporter [Nocardia brasiliensis NBRC 14402]|uniref:cation:proton antiporter n=1 Tax=Nocardia brasiliensis TaxID=37326 RepID=UPI00030D6A18|nr:cation:proton antiporter [Nocardia brasiliensis]ASF11607.1 cation/H(+) antiporter [Nocardia brasiliensis]GAJ82695.1 putative sodium/hydrogen antiporter [Nocardia brasiliensis NBRC 14402]SUB09604.1 K(+)/H(+) antiporter [Nocardia brasiliensis]